MCSVMIINSTVKARTASYSINTKSRIHSKMVNPVVSMDYGIQNTLSDSIRSVWFGLMTVHASDSGLCSRILFVL